MIPSLERSHATVDLGVELAEVEGHRGEAITRNPQS